MTLRWSGVGRGALCVTDSVPLILGMSTAYRYCRFLKTFRFAISRGQRQKRARHIKVRPPGTLRSQRERAQKKLERVEANGVALRLRRDGLMIEISALSAAPATVQEQEIGGSSRDQSAHMATSGYGSNGRPVLVLLAATGRMLTQHVARDSMKSCGWPMAPEARTLRLPRTCQRFHVSKRFFSRCHHSAGHTRLASRSGSRKHSCQRICLTHSTKSWSSKVARGQPKPQVSSSMLGRSGCRSCPSVPGEPR